MFSLQLVTTTCRNSDLLDMFMRRPLYQVVTSVDDPKDKKCSSLHFFLHSAVPIYDISYHKSDERLSHSHNKYLKSLRKPEGSFLRTQSHGNWTSDRKFAFWFILPPFDYGSFLFMPYGTTFLRVLIFAVFPAIRKNRFRQIKITNVNIF